MDRFLWNKTTTEHFIGQKAEIDLKSLGIFLSVWLLVLLLLTIWLFKEKRVSFIHESGLALFYGNLLNQ